MNSVDCHSIAVFGQETGTESRFSCLESGENVSAHAAGLKQDPTGKSTKSSQKRVIAVVLTQLVASASLLTPAQHKNPVFFQHFHLCSQKKYSCFLLLSFIYFKHTGTHTHTHTHARTCTRTHTHAHRHVHVDVYTRTHTHTANHAHWSSVAVSYIYIFLWMEDKL